MIKKTVHKRRSSSLLPSIQNKYVVWLGILGLLILFVFSAQKVIGERDSNESSQVNKLNAVQQSDRVCTNSTEYSDIPGMNTSFSLSQTDRVVALFSGEWTPGGVVARIRLVVDGKPQPGEVLQLDTDGYTESSGFNFVSEVIPKREKDDRAKGDRNDKARNDHTAALQWKVDAGNNTCLSNRSLIVLHN